jgi:hypothetical protein
LLAGQEHGRTIPLTDLALLGLALQLPFMRTSESMGNHDSKVVDAGSVDRRDACVMGGVAS